MKVEMKVIKEVDIKTLLVFAGVRYWEDAEINGIEDTESGNGIPCKSGGMWMPKIDVETGVITNWEDGKSAFIHYKVCDQCSWQLLDEQGFIVVDVENEYVPETLAPEGKGYGDYIKMRVDENGKIANWKFKAKEFFKNED